VVHGGAAGRSRRTWLLAGSLAVWGPGLAVMLADTDAGSLVTAAQSGTTWGYAMVLPLLALIPVLYVVQEMTIRLGISTGRGHGALITEHFGRRWALLSVGTLVITCTGALVTEFAGIAAVGECYGVPRAVSVPLAATFLVGIVVTGSYRRIERVAVALGLAELAFLPAVLLAHPSPRAIGQGLTHLPVQNGSFLVLLAANVGAVIMPWMIFYQQGAVVAKGLQLKDIASERRDTKVGAVITQLIMVMMVVLFAATVGLGHRGQPLHDVAQMSAVLRPFVGTVAARALLGATVLGAALVAAIVSSLAAAWGISEVTGWAHSLDGGLARASARFYATFGAVCVLGAAGVLLSLNLVSLIIDVEVMNALLLPIVLGLLLALETRALPIEHRMSGARRVVTTGLCVTVMGLGLVLVPLVLFSHP